MKTVYWKNKGFYFLSLGLIALILIGLVSVEQGIVVAIQGPLLLIFAWKLTGDIGHQPVDPERWVNSALSKATFVVSSIIVIVLYGYRFLLASSIT